MKLFTVNNNYLQLIKLLTVDNYLPLMKIFTVNKNMHLLSHGSEYNMANIFLIS